MVNTIQKTTYLLRDSLSYSCFRDGWWLWWVEMHNPECWAGSSCAFSSGVWNRIKPVYPFHGYGFSAGTEFPTRTRTPGKPVALTCGFSKPVTFPSVAEVQFWTDAENRNRPNRTGSVWPLRSSVQFSVLGFQKYFENRFWASLNRTEPLVFSKKSPWNDKEIALIHPAPTLNLYLWWTIWVYHHITSHRYIMTTTILHHI